MQNTGQAVQIEWSYEFATGSKLTQKSDVISVEGDYYKATFTRQDGSQTITHVHKSQVNKVIEPCGYCGHVGELYDDGVNRPSCGNCGGI